MRKMVTTLPKGEILPTRIALVRRGLVLAALGLDGTPKASEMPSKTRPYTSPKVFRSSMYWSGMTGFIGSSVQVPPFGEKVKGPGWIFRSLPLGLVLFLGCSGLNGPDESISFLRRDYFGTEIRIDGYYSRVFPSDSNNIPVQRVAIRFFNRNGVSLYGGSPTISELAGREVEFRSGEFFRKYRDRKSYWGAFKVEDSTLVDEGWVNPNGRYLVVRETFKILDDTTLRLVQSERIDGSSKSVLDEIFQFKVFNPKPDSVVGFFH